MLSMDFQKICSPSLRIGLPCIRLYCDAKIKTNAFFICIVKVLWSHNFYTVSSNTISFNIEGENLIFLVKLYIISFKHHFSLFSTQMTKFSHIKMKCALENDKQEEEVPSPSVQKNITLIQKNPENEFYTHLISQMSDKGTF